MLGRTDSRRRLLVLLTVFVVGSLALVRADRVLAGPARRFPDGAGGGADDGQDRGRGPARRHLRPDRHRPARHHDRPRPTGRRRGPARTRSGGTDEDRQRARPPPRARRGRGRDAAREAGVGTAVHRPRPRHRAVRGRAHPPGAARRADRPRRPRAGAGAGLPAGGRRTRVDPGRPSARLRQPREQRPVRRRAGLPGDPRRQPADHGRPARRERAADARDGRGRGARHRSARTSA